MIRLLSKDVSDKIAAGEVIERPLSIVKELVENSIDAGAETITVEIKNGGKSYIRITDDGCGIPKDQAIIAFERHATSKIISDKDLNDIVTLGFRGEALASIAAVSNTELITKTREEGTGCKVVIRGGSVAESTAIGCPEGTTVVVTDLFYNTPARQKFMKSDASESSVIIDFISQIALAYKDIKIRMINNGVNLFFTNGRGDRLNNIMTVYGQNVGSDLIALNSVEGYLQIEGYISTPKVSKTNKRSQILFVNGRVVSNKIVDAAISKAYSDRLFEGKFPITYLFLQIEPDMVDVNIHPNKREVRFNDEILVSEFVTEAIRQALSSKEAIPQVRKDDIFKISNNNSIIKEEKNEFLYSSSVKDCVASNKEKVKTPLEPENSKPETINIKEEQVDIKNILSTYRGQKLAESDESTSKSIEIPVASRPFEFSELRVLGSIFATYITLVDDDTFYLIDQHAAHERIFFERFVSQYEASEKVIQPILTPFTVEVPYSVKVTSEKWIDLLKSFGYEVEEFGPRTLIVKGIPIFMELKEAENFINYFVENIDDKMNIQDPRKLEKIATNACKSAVKGNQILDISEINQLILDLSKCKNPYSCPHGRPTFIKMTKHEIEKMFRRI